MSEKPAPCRSCEADAARYRYLVKVADRGGAHLFRLLGEGKGTEDDFHRMVDRLMASEAAAVAKVRQTAKAGGMKAESPPAPEGTSGLHVPIAPIAPIA